MNLLRARLARLSRQADVRMRRAWGRWAPRLAYWSAAALIGVAAALFGLGGEAAYTHFAALAHDWPILPLLLVPGGLIAVAWVTRYWVPEAAGSGIPQVLAALSNEGREVRARLLSLRVAVLKILLTVVGLASGASVGREGPTVQVGAAIARLAGEGVGMRVGPGMQRSLILAGGAAGVAAAFNTPIAGIVFAFEELARSLDEKASGTLLVLVIIAAVVAMSLLGHRVYLGEVDVHLDRWEQWRAVLVCGLAGGICGALFSHLLVLGTRRIRPLIAQHGLAVPLVCGLLVALVGLASTGTTYGSGYEETLLALESPDELPVLFPLLKALATLLSYLSGIPGGIFSPSLAVGAGLGAELAPYLAGIPVAAIVLLAMTAYFAGVTQAPLTAAVIVSEMTLDQRMILPLMAASLLAAGAGRLVWRDSIYQALMRDLLATPVATAADPSSKPPRTGQ